MVTSVLDRNDVKSEYGIIPSLIPRKLFYENNAVEKFTRLNLASSIVLKDDDEFNQITAFVDPDFFDMFTFTASEGFLKLKARDDVIISSSFALKIFGDVSAIGKELRIIINSKDHSFVVSGVFQDFHEVTSIDFDVFLHIDATDKFEMDKNNPRTFVNAGFIQLNNIESPEAILENQQSLIDENNSLNYNWIVDHFNLIPLTDLSAKTSKIQSDIGKGYGSFATDIILILISLSILIIACLNNANLSIVSSSKRLNEIALRKIYGANKVTLMSQFLFENFIILSFSYFSGVLLAKTLLIPGFDDLFNFGLSIKAISLVVWLLLTLSIILSIFLSVSYPAIYISSFRIIEIFKGKLKFGNKNWTSKILHVVQFTFSIILIFSAISIFKYVKSERNKNYGYNIENTLFVPLQDDQSYYRLKNILESRYTNNLNITGSKHHIGISSIETLITGKDDKQIKATKFDVGENYFEVVGLEIIEGTNFEKGYQLNLNSIVVNEAFVDQMGWQNILDKSVIIDKGRYYVVGVVNNFIFGNPNEPIRPAFFRIIAKSDYNFLVAGSAVNDPKMVLNELNKAWLNDIGDRLEGQDQSNIYFSYFKILKGHSNIILFLAILATLLSMMGLYALLSLNLASKMRIFSIKKVLGVSDFTLVYEVSKDVMSIVIIALVLGVGISFFSMSWLFKIVYKVEWSFDLSTFFLTLIVISVITVLTLVKFINSVLKTNPIKHLRYE
jgi:ABC-type antimicrobial peptide transport system permease subunit